MIYNSYMIEDIFKVPLFKTTLDLNNKLIKKACYQEQKKSKGVSLSNLTGWQSEPLAWTNKTFIPLYDAILEQGRIFASLLSIKNNLQINNIWININEYKDANNIHTHPHALLSGVYYVSTPKDCGDIVFLSSEYSNAFQHEWSKQIVETFNPYNSPEMNVVANSGDLLLFPNWLLHRVKPNLNKTEKRISISFNLGLMTKY